jgi:uncharacterized protein YbjT (DUF2867 family)
MIALTTPTGRIGSKILARLLDSSITKIRVLARNPDKIREHERVQVIAGSMEDREALTRLLEGATSLFWCQPDAPTAADYIGAYETLSRLGAKAIRDAGISHVVAISAVGEPGNTPAGPITALHRMECILAEGNASIRYLRCGSFFENLLWQWDQILEQGCFGYPAPGDVPGPQVATTDIARVAADLLLNPDWVGQELVPLIGPQDLSYDEIASLVSHAIGKPVRFESMDAETYITAMAAIGQSASAAQGLIDMFRFLASGYSSPANASRSLTPTTLTVWLNQEAKGN